ncbi:hypothetical protein B5G09_02645 [Alistipes sp. An54]|nr:hypothetical protein B5G09_02645 [Alistipes sp. An54]
MLRQTADDPKSLLMAEVMHIVEGELLRMSPLRRRVFIVYRYEEMSYREIAAICSLTESRVDYEICAAKKMLRVTLKDYLPLDCREINPQLVLNAWYSIFEYYKEDPQRKLGIKVCVSVETAPKSRAGLCNLTEETGELLMSANPCSRKKISAASGTGSRSFFFRSR